MQKHSLYLKTTAYIPILNPVMVVNQVHLVMCQEAELSFLIYDFTEAVMYKKMLGETIYQLRKEKGLSQKGFALFAYPRWKIDTYNKRKGKGHLHLVEWLLVQ